MTITDCDEDCRGITKHNEILQKVPKQSIQTNAKDSPMAICFGGKYKGFAHYRIFGSTAFKRGGLFFLNAAKHKNFFKRGGVLNLIHTQDFF